MDAISQFDMHIGVFLKHLQSFGKSEMVEFGKSTAELLTATLTAIDEILTKAPSVKNLAIGKDTKYILNLNDEYFELRQHIECRVCSELILAFSDDLNVRLQNKEHLMKIEPFWKSNVNSDHIIKNISYANVLRASNNSCQKNVVMSNANATNHATNDNGQASYAATGEKMENASKIYPVKSSTAFDPNSEHLVRLRGLSWSTNKHEIAKFLSGVNILNGLDGIHYVVDNPCGYGEAFVQLASTQDFFTALKKHKHYLDNRYIEVLANVSVEHFSRLIERRNHVVDDKMIRINNLSRNTDESDIRDLLHGLPIDDLYMSYIEDSVLKDVFVEFANSDAADIAIRFNGEKVLNRSVHIYRSSDYERNCICLGQNPFKREDAFIDVQSTSTLKVENCSYMVMASGFRWNITKNDVHEFFEGINIFNGDDSIYIVKDLSMKAYIQFATKADRKKALAKHLKRMHSRTIYVTEIELAEYMEVKNKNMEKSENVDCVVKIRGLPFSADEQYIVKLFEGLRIDPVKDVLIQWESLVCRSGFGFVKFENSEDFHKAMNTKVQNINKYLKLFKSTKKEFAETLAANAKINEVYTFPYPTSLVEDEGDLPAFFNN